MVVDAGRAASAVPEVEPKRHEQPLLAETLDRAHNELRAGDGEQAVRTATVGLEQVRRRIDAERWESEVVPACREHPVWGLFCQDPYTQRALAKPRGFAGDAVMLDFLYDGEPPAGTSPLGHSVFRGTALSPSGRSVVERRDRLAKLLHEVCGARPRARVLSIGCGHLREAQCSGGISAGSFEAFYALDQDEEALALVEAQQRHTGVTPRRGSVRELIAGRVGFEDLDLVYAAGLFDYLSDAVSGRLLARMASYLAPGGRLLVGNFTPTNWGRSYMDAFMDWQLTYRTAADLRDIARASGAANEMALERMGVDPLGNIAYLELTRGPLR